MKRIVVNVCHSCMVQFATYGEVPRRWLKVGCRLYCARCAKAKGQR